MVAMDVATSTSTSSMTKRRRTSSLMKHLVPLYVIFIQCFPSSLGASSLPSNGSLYNNRLSSQSGPRPSQQRQRPTKRAPSAAATAATATATQSSAAANAATFSTIRSRRGRIPPASDDVAKAKASVNSANSSSSPSTPRTRARARPNSGNTSRQWRDPRIEMMTGVRRPPLSSKGYNNGDGDDDDDDDNDNDDWDERFNEYSGQSNEHAANEFDREDLNDLYDETMFDANNDDNRGVTSDDVGNRLGIDLSSPLSSISFQSSTFGARKPAPRAGRAQKQPKRQPPPVDRVAHRGDDYEQDELDNEEDAGSFSSSSAGKHALYDAYNQLHGLAQAYDKPFDAPAVVVVGHQSSGKSALIEALMGFQFNQVGGGTKTRRPVALRMQYNPTCHQPNWFLLGEDGVERPMSLADIQDYIEKENRRLERDPVRSFDPREINVRMEYKHCPNMILIDTPGLIAAPRIPKGSAGSGAALAQQRALQASAREAERLVVDKMRCEDYIILCVEDTSDWKHGATREIVQKADPDLSRTVIVNTKFDTKVPQFGTPSDLEDFVRAPILDRISPHKLGGPFFTSVPSGRVGREMDDLGSSSGDYLFDRDEDFVFACSDSEQGDRSLLIQRLKRIGKANEVASAGLTGRIGLSRLRKFLEQRVDECYRRNVQKIVPMLQSEYVVAERRLRACEQELQALSIERLKAGADAFCDEFCQCLRKALQGSIMAPAHLFGETLVQEATAAGSFHGIQGSPMGVSDRTWDRLVDTEVGNKEHRLYGGSQYHRTLREFHLATRCLRLPTITEDEIANAAGLGETHDGVNFLHASCVIALEKARLSFEPLLRSLQIRMNHVMERLCPVAEYMLRENRERAKVTTSMSVDDKGRSGGGDSGLESIESAMDISQNPQFRQLIRAVFEKFVLRCSDSAMSKCRDDLLAITRYVTWNLDGGGSGALSRALPDQTDIIAVYQVALESSRKGSEVDPKRGAAGPSGGDADSLTSSQRPLTPMPVRNKGVDQDYQNLLQLMEEAVMSRDANRTNMVVGGLVHHIVAHWRLQFCKSVITKFNCYFMLPFVDEFHRFIRREMQKLYEGDDDSLTDVFDLTTARRSLEQHRNELANECAANKRLQEKFRKCADMMRQHDGRDSIFDHLNVPDDR